MAAPTYVATGTYATNSGVAGLPAGWAADDIHVLVMESGPTDTITVSGGGTWNDAPFSPLTNVAAGNGSRLTVKWRRAVAGDVGPTLSASADHVIGYIVGIRGCSTSGNPWNTQAGSTQSTGATITVTGVTTTVADTLVMLIASQGEDNRGEGAATFSSWTNSNLGSLTERGDAATETGHGGAVGVATGTMVAAGATGDTTVATGASIESAFCFAVIAFNFTPPAVTGTAGASFSWATAAWGTVGVVPDPVTGTGASSFGFSAAGSGSEGYVGIQSHLSINGHEYLVRPGSYVKRQAPQFGARFTTGDPGLNNLSFWQHWAQRSWIGGVDQDVWSDTQMYDQGVGVDTTEADQVRLARGLARGSGANWVLSSGSSNATNGFRSIVYNSTLYVLTLSEPNVIGHLWQYNAVTEAWSRITSLDASDIATVSIAVFDGKLYVGGSSRNTTIGKLVFSSGNLTTWTTVTNPVGLDTVSGGNITGVAATDLLTSATAHGFVEGDVIRFSTLTGGTGLSVLTSYYVIAGGLTSTTFKVSASFGGAAVDFTTDVTAATAGKLVDSTVTAMRAFQQKLYDSYSVQVWRLSIDQTWDGSTIFYRVNLNSESDGIVSMATHFGYLYMLSEDGHIHRTDGSSTFDIWSWDGQTEGISIKSFDGRLFILAFEYSSTPDVGYGVLYQMSGSAVTQLKRWGDEADATRIGSMTVYDRKLFYGASNLLGFGDTNGFGVACYDPTEDAHSIAMSNTDQVTYPPGSAPYRNYIVDDQEFFEGKAFVFVRGFGGFLTPFAARDAVEGVRRYDVSSAGASSGSLNGGWFTTSTYDAGTPGLLKLWRKVTIDAHIVASTSIVIEYSTDDGTSWTVLATAATVASRGLLEYWLENVKGTSLKLRFTLRSTDSTVSPSLHAIQVSYVPLPEPNWLWTFTVVLSESQQGVDGVTRALDTEAEMAYLAALHRTKELVNYVDIDGLHWSANGAPGVLIYDIEFRVLLMTQPLEGEVVITLLEAVEEYV